MNAGSASLINAAILILIGAWGAYETNWAGTSFIPVVGGVILLLLNGGVKKENKVIAHIAVLLTLLLLIGLMKPLSAAFADDRTMAIVRVGIMMVSCIFAMLYFIKSFRDARKARENVS